MLAAIIKRGRRDKCHEVWTQNTKSEEISESKNHRKAETQGKKSNQSVLRKERNGVASTQEKDL